MFKKEIIYSGLGRRKSSVARIIIKTGTGKFIINKRESKEYLRSDILIKDAIQPLEILKLINLWDINVNVRGGGLSGQSGAIRLGLSRALIKTNSEYRPKLKLNGLLTRDSRIKERKKPGLRKARKSRQFSKR